MNGIIFSISKLIFFRDEFIFSMNEFNFFMNALQLSMNALQLSWSVLQLSMSVLRISWNGFRISMNGFRIFFLVSMVSVGTHLFDALRPKPPLIDAEHSSVPFPRRGDCFKRFSYFFYLWCHFD